MTEEEIDAARTPSGGWTKQQLAEWGVPWPPPKGWKKKLVRASTQEPNHAAGHQPQACMAHLPTRWLATIRSNHVLNPL